MGLTLPSSIFTQRHQEFIAFIASVRRASGITQVELAERLGKPQSFVSKVERGERRLDLIEFCQIAEALGYEAPQLLQEFVDLRRG